MNIHVIHSATNKPHAEYALCQSPYGKCLVATTEQGVCWLSFCNDDGTADISAFVSFWGEKVVSVNQKNTDKLVDKIFSGDKDIDIVLFGSAFQVAVWRALCEIPRGARCSYSDIAVKIGRPKAVRAVASAIGQNNISYIVPCHRVLRRDGSLGGYRWGIDIKCAMLDAESRK